MYSQECLQEDEEEGIALVAEGHPSSHRDFASTETSAPAYADQRQSSPPTLFSAACVHSDHSGEHHLSTINKVKRNKIWTFHRIEAS